MENIYIEGTLKHPFINFNASGGVLELSGRSTPENSEAIYKPLIDWTKEYTQNPFEKTTVNIKFEYFNSSTSKYLIRLLDVLSEIPRNGKALEVNWYYFDDELKEYGQDFADVLEINFNFIQADLNQ